MSTRTIAGFALSTFALPVAAALPAASVKVMLENASSIFSLNVRATSFGATARVVPACGSELLSVACAAAIGLAKTVARTAAAPITLNNAFISMISCVCSLSLFDGGHGQCAVHLVGGKAHLVTLLHLAEHCRILYPEDHGHAGHAQILDVTVFDRDLATILVDLLNFPIGQCRARSRSRRLLGMRHRARGQGCQADQRCGQIIQTLLHVFLQ